MSRHAATLALLTSSLMLGACSATVNKLANVGRAPAFTPIDELNPPPQAASLAHPGMADAAQSQAAIAQGPQATQPTSLWRTGAKAFFRDQRATRVGDIVTVRINVSDRAQVDNTTTRSRQNSEQAGLPNLLGLESRLGAAGMDPSNLVNGTSSSNSTGAGQVQRSENINMTVAAIVTGVLPNGNLVIRGRQEVRVNFEVRELIIAGIVRAEDISSDNTIRHTQIAEARISYGGRGQLTDVQQARYGQQVYDALFPW
jgi:flagellar L-ring protein FlgH